MHRDAGVDGRYFRQDGSEVILQCKHWPAAPLERLSKYLRDIELLKLHKLKPARYVLALSHPLSRTDKDRITALLAPYVLNPSDILGKEDLNDLLANNPDVESRHYKLWIGSTAVLRHLLNKPIRDRSAFAMEEILRDGHLYVPTPAHDNAIAKLEERGTVIITGPAGIGKTTLAEHLAVHYMAQGFSLVKITEEIREAEAVYEPAERQLFYFDDFLGRNYLEALSGHEGAHIVQFIKRIIRDKQKRFVLTSRTTILNQGKLLIDVFHTNNLERNEFEVTVESFSEIDRARILYNHIWHGTLPREHLDELYRDRRYRLIVGHRNYNPRLIRFITDSERLSGLPPAQYWAYAKALLDNPAKVWENPFDAQLDDFGRAAVLLVTLHGRHIVQVELAEAYSRFIADPSANSMHGRRDFLQTLRHLSGSLLSRALLPGREPVINLFNPSIGDFVLHRYAEDLPALRAGFSSLRSTSSLRTLASLRSGNLIGAATAISIASQILTNAHARSFLGYSPDYIALAILTAKGGVEGLGTDDSMVREAVAFIVKSDCPHNLLEVSDVTYWGVKNAVVSEEEASQFLASACAQSPNSDELKKLAAILILLDDSVTDDLRDTLLDAAVEYLVGAVHDEFDDNGVFDGVEPGDTDDAERNLTTLVEAKLEALGVTPSDSAIESVVDAYGVRARMDDFFQDEEDYSERTRTQVAGLQTDAIDDLFDRSGFG